MSFTEYLESASPHPVFYEIPCILSKCTNNFWVFPSCSQLCTKKRLLLVQNFLITLQYLTFECLLRVIAPVYDELVAVGEDLGAEVTSVNPWWREGPALPVRDRPLHLPSHSHAPLQLAKHLVVSQQLVDVLHVYWLQQNSLMA